MSLAQSSLFQAAPCGLLRTEANGLILVANDRFCNWTGFSAEELIGKIKLQDLFTIGGRIFHQTHFSPLLQMQGSVSEVKFEFKHRDGHAIPMVINAIRHVEDGVVLHDVAAFIARDRHKYEQELINSQKRLKLLVEETNQLKELATARAMLAEQMMGIVGHDLRNPLATIQMSMQLMKRGELTPEQAKIVHRVSRSVDLSKALISDLLDFTAARLAGGLGINRREIELHAAIASAVEDLSQAFPDSKIQHRHEGDGQVSADAMRLTQLVGNLVANAVAYGKSGTPIIVTSAVNEDGISISVSNEGEPIPQEVQTALFEPFTRGNVEGAARSVGLGLFIVREIARAHGGDMLVRSTNDTGTQFTARLPRLQSR